MYKNLPELYLASKSPRRREILGNLGVPFKLIDSPYEEKFEDVQELNPAEMAKKLASLKAFHAASSLRSGIVIGADTIVVKGDSVLGKPSGKQEATDMLSSLSGASHKVITGIAVVDAEGFRTLSHSEITTVHFRDLTQKDIDQYLETGEPFDKAGAYGIQGYAALFVDRLEGCYFNVVGFPVVAFRNLLLELGYDITEYIEVEKK